MPLPPISSIKLSTSPGLVPICNGSAWLFWFGVCVLDMIIYPNGSAKRAPETDETRETRAAPEWKATFTFAKHARNAAPLFF